MIIDDFHVEIGDLALRWETDGGLGPVVGLDEDVVLDDLLWCAAVVHELDNDLLSATGTDALGELAE